MKRKTSQAKKKTASKKSRVARPPLQICLWEKQVCEVPPNKSELAALNEEQKFQTQYCFHKGEPCENAVKYAGDQLTDDECTLLFWSIYSSWQDESLLDVNFGRVAQAIAFLGLVDWTEKFKTTAWHILNSRKVRASPTTFVSAAEFDVFADPKAFRGGRVSFDEVFEVLKDDSVSWKAKSSYMVRRGRGDHIVKFPFCPRVEEVLRLPSEILPKLKPRKLELGGESVRYFIEPFRNAKLSPEPVPLQLFLGVVGYVSREEIAQVPIANRRIGPCFDFCSTNPNNKALLHCDEQGSPIEVHVTMAAMAAWTSPPKKHKELAKSGYPC